MPTSADDHILSESSPNAETIKAMKETDEGKSLVSCENFEDFVKKLDSKSTTHD